MYAIFFLPELLIFYVILQLRFRSSAQLEGRTHDQLQTGMASRKAAVVLTSFPDAMAAPFLSPRSIAHFGGKFTFNLFLITLLSLSETFKELGYSAGIVNHDGDEEESIDD